MNPNNTRSSPASSAVDTRSVALRRYAHHGATLLLTAVALVGCTVPGMHMGRTPPTAEYPDAPPPEVTARADVYKISPKLVARMTEEQHAMGEALRRTALTQLPRRSEDGYRYRVGPGDVLRIIVFNQPELTNPTGTANELSGRVVNSDGTFFFPFAGKVVASGRTVQEIRENLQRALDPFLKNPQIEVSVLQYRSQRVFVAGEVAKPGPQVITDVPVRITDAIGVAGGPLPTADLTEVSVTRNDKTFQLDLYHLFFQGDMTQNIILEDGDLLHVGEQRFNKVFVVGDFNQPASFVMPRGRYTLAEAISDAGGVNPFAGDAGQIFVVRWQANAARPQIFHLDASSPDALVLADRFDLRARDVVFVDAVGAVRWARVVNLLLPTADFLRQTTLDVSKGLPR
ncbi:MAG TPA: polysaccharide biosynthesis/export family protein [Burkholderiaceae bacterium]|nr:polysaccharide biosynthesis/export family protein [Burkholderiaceae bacterium]